MPAPSQTRPPLAQIDDAFAAVRAIQNPEAYTARYLAPRVQYLQWYRLVDQHLQKNPMSLILVHAGSGKSTRVGFIQALLEVCRDRTARIGYFSKTQAKASLFMTAVGRELRHNQKIIHDWGPFYDSQDPDQTWSTEAIRVIGSDRSKATPSLINVGVTSQIESLRLTSLIMDDPIDLNTALSQAETSRMDKLFGTLIDRLDPGGRLVIIGHRFLPNDFYQRIIDTRPEVTPLVLAAYHKPGNPSLPDDQGVPLVPELWPHPTLLLEKRDRHRGWEWKAWYQQERISPEDSTFGDIPRPLTRDVPRGAVVAAYDPAYSTSDASDWSVATAGTRGDQGLVVTDLMDWHIASGWASEFVRFAHKVGARTAYVEVNNAQTLGDEMRRVIADQGLSITVIDYRSRGRKTFRLGELADAALQGDIQFHQDLEHRPAYQRLINEWNLYPNIDHDDHLDALDILRRVTIQNRKRARVGRSRF